MCMCARECYAAQLSQTKGLVVKTTGQEQLQTSFHPNYSLFPLHTLSSVHKLVFNVAVLFDPFLSVFEIKSVTIAVTTVWKLTWAGKHPLQGWVVHGRVCPHCQHKPEVPAPCLVHFSHGAQALGFPSHAFHTSLEQTVNNNNGDIILFALSQVMYFFKMHIWHLKFHIICWELTLTLFECSKSNSLFQAQVTLLSLRGAKLGWVNKGQQKYPHLDCLQCCHHSLTGFYSPPPQLILKQAPIHQPSH